MTFNDLDYKFKNRDSYLPSLRFCSFEFCEMKLTSTNERIEESSFKYDCFDESQLTGVHFIGCRFISCSFTGSRMSKCIFTECEFYNCNLSYVVFDDCVFDKSYMNGVIVTKTDGLDYDGSEEVEELLYYKCSDENVVYDGLMVTGGKVYE
jgi:uncharacterized protein YjbI with pentapeptide repeats